MENQEIMTDVVEELIRQHKTIATMESCTGGGVANAITNVPGASEILYGSRITYSNRDKIMSGINPQTIERFTVYSAEVAREMAKSISNIEDSDYGIGVTGKLRRADINNPSPQDDGVYVCIYDRDNDHYYEFYQEVDKERRRENKELIISKIAEAMNRILSLSAKLKR